MRGSYVKISTLQLERYCKALLEKIADSRSAAEADGLLHYMKRQNTGWRYFFRWLWSFGLSCEMDEHQARLSLEAEAEKVGSLTGSDWGRWWQNKARKHSLLKKRTKELLALAKDKNVEEIWLNDRDYQILTEDLTDNGYRYYW